MISDSSSWFARDRLSADEDDMSSSSERSILSGESGKPEWSIERELRRGCSTVDGARIGELAENSRVTAGDTTWPGVAGRKPSMELPRGVGGRMLSPRGVGGLQVHMQSICRVQA